MNRDKQRRIMTLVVRIALCSFTAGAIIILLIVAQSFRKCSAIPEPEPPEITVTSLELPDKPIIAEPLAYITPETVEPVMPLEEVTEPDVNVIEDCIVTYYCAEQYPHICGDGDGLTATMTEVCPGRTCAVDPSVIPLGSVVSVDYGDGVLHDYIAEDVGAWVTEAHIDICVATHNEALELGRRTATVYWEVVA